MKTSYSTRERLTSPTNRPNKPAQILVQHSMHRSRWIITRHEKRIRIRISFMYLLYITRDLVVTLHLHRYTTIVSQWFMLLRQMRSRYLICQIEMFVSVRLQQPLVNRDVQDPLFRAVADPVHILASHHPSSVFSRRGSLVLSATSKKKYCDPNHRSLWLVASEEAISNNVSTHYLR